MTPARLAYFEECVRRHTNITPSLAAELLEHIQAQAAVVEIAKVALEHCKHRPHEHNPGPEFTVTHCEVIDRALAALSTPTDGSAG